MNSYYVLKITTDYCGPDKEASIKQRSFKDEEKNVKGLK